LFINKYGMKPWLFILLIAGSLTCFSQHQGEFKSTFIEEKTWYDARHLLSDTTIVVIPLGAAAKEHGPHLLLKNDFLIAEYLKNRIASVESAVLYPTINYHYYPSFLEYPGSTSLHLETASNLIVEICQVIARHGPKKFYILNTGVSTLVPLKIASEELAQQGLILAYTDILNIAKDAEEKIRQQSEGTHADELETSMMLYMAPATVDMSKAAKDIPVNRIRGPLTPNPSGQGNYSPTGIYGDATLATVQKGEIIVEAMVNGILTEINQLRKLKTPKAPSIDLIKFSGTYSREGTERSDIEIKNGALVLVEDGRPDRMLLFRKQNAFTIGSIGRIVFFEDTRGNINQAFMSMSGKEYLLTKQ
jgi:creatinine amidohydrolase